jgi:EmrB/QacA subfamily drug resistance transporter
MGGISVTKQTNSTQSRKWLCFVAIALGTFVSYLDSSIVNIALPTLTEYFQADLTITNWVVTSYLLMITGLVVIFGRLADMYGRKRLYIFGLIVFTFSSALCGAAPNIWALIAFRCLQGVGAAALLANGAALVTETFPSAERGRALGMVGSVLAVAVIIGPLAGGFLTDYLGWRSIFYVNVLPGIIGILLAAKVLPAKAITKSSESFDLIGAITLFAFLSCLLFLTGVLSKPDWQLSVFAPLLISTIVLAVIFVVNETRVEHALLDLRIFRKRGFSAAALSSFLSFWAISSISFLMPFYFERVLLLNPTMSGALLAPVPIVLVVMAPLGGFLADKFGVRAICTIGALINCLGLVFLSTLDMHTTRLGVIMRLIPFGVGMGLFQPPNNSAMMGAVPGNRLGIVSGMISALKNLGSMTGVAVTSLVLTLTQLSVMGELQTLGIPGVLAERQSFVSAVRVMSLLSAGICAIVVLTSLFRGKERVDKEHESLATAPGS